MEKGYSEEQAKISLKFARNNLEKAMGNLKRREDRSSSETTTSRVPFNKTQKEDRFGRKGRIEESEGAKPSNKVSLFDFLEDKIKIPKVSMPSDVSKMLSSGANLMKFYFFFRAPKQPQRTVHQLLIKQVLKRQMNHILRRITDLTIIHLRIEH